MTTIRVLIADDHGIVRDGLRTLIDSQADLQVVAEVEAADAVAPMCAASGAEVVLLDLTMPGGGLSAIPALRELALPPRVLVLTMHDRTAYLRQAFETGADGYVVKQAAGTVLLDAIRAVARGERYVHASLPPGGLAEVLQGISEQDAGPGSVSLSRREQEVLGFVASGYTNREAADRLGLSVKTVEGYRARLVKKLGARSRVDLVRFAKEAGLIDTEEL